MEVDEEQRATLVQVGRDGSASVAVSALVAEVEQAFGLAGGYLDMTGGNCAAVRWNLDGGAHLLITHGDSFTYSRGDLQPYFDGWTAGVYIGDSLPVGMATTERPDTEALLECVRLALRANGDHWVG